MAKYIVVKHAGDSAWEYYFVSDPKEFDCHISVSAFYTPTGNEICNLYYTEEQHDLALQHCAKMNEVNPSGHYRVCRVSEDSLKEVLEQKE